MENISGDIDSFMGKKLNIGILCLMVLASFAVLL